MGTHAFQAEVGRVLSLVINSLYSNKEIFLRELVSNASDALDKLRFRAVPEPALLDGEPTLIIRLRIDEAARVLVIEDTGIGMTEAELRSRYGAGLQVRPHKYDTAARYLIYQGPDDSSRRLVFETDRRQVIRYRGGVMPAVEYVEGCS